MPHQPQTKQCANCTKDFTIEPEDFEFYDKIQVPAPTWCPECRMIRRMVFSNERSLYSRQCDLCKKDIISMYSKDTIFPIYCIQCWNSDNWNPEIYAQEYNFSKPFFEQIFDLKRKVPRPALFHQGNMVNSDYCNRSSNNTNCYLCFRANFNEDSMYSHFLNDSKECLDCLNVQKSELIYDSIDCVNCYKVSFSQECKDCTESMFLYNCSNCSNCFACVNLRNKQYCIFNKQYTKDDYQKILNSYRLNIYSNLDYIKLQFKIFSLDYIRRFMMSVNSEDVSGNWLLNCKNVFNSFTCRNIEYGKDLYGIIDGKDLMDYTLWGRNSELMYEDANCGYNCYKVLFSNECFSSCNNIEYCDNCTSSQNIFACIGLRNKEYCILNKQYTKEEYFQMVEKIKDHMNKMPYIDKQGRIYKYGEFFPPDLSPFAYNETMAQEYCPLSEYKVLQGGFKWKGGYTRDYKVDFMHQDIPDDIYSIDEDSMIGKVIQCAHYNPYTKESICIKNKNICNANCTQAFKIIKPEYEFYKKMNLPLPRLCPNCRHYQRIKQRNPLKLWKRKCQCNGNKSDNGVYQNTTTHFHGQDHCPNEFYTSYSPDRPEIVYCEKCYQSEVV